MASEYNNIVTIKFARAEQPKFEEHKGQGYVKFGENNNYPDFLLNLYNESPKHGAIVRGKMNYVFGKGFKDLDVPANTQGQSWNDVLKRCVLDDGLFGGYYLQIVWNKAGKVKDVFHLRYASVRTNKEENCFYVKNDWQDNKEKARMYSAFSGTFTGEYSEVLYVKRYTPEGKIYPFPEYFQGLNYIDADVQVSRHILGNAKDGFVAGTMIQLNNGEPQAEQKESIEKRLKKKFTGSEGDRVLIMFNSSRDNAAEVTPLGQTMLTKEDFTNINQLIQQEIFAAHQITSPALFGIKTEGQLGGRTELRDAYEIFNNTYVQERQQTFNEVFGKLMGFVGVQGEFKIEPVEPIKYEFGEAIVSQNLTKDEIREVMGKAPLDPAIKTQAQIISENINALSPLVANKVLESMTPDEIRSLAGLVPANGQPLAGDGSMPAPPAAQPNSVLANMTGRQFQQLERIKRKFERGILTREQAAMMLKNSFGFGDEDVALFLDANAEDQQFALQDEVDFALIEGFAQVGEPVDQFEILSKRPAGEVEYFAEVKDLTEFESNVMNLISKDKRITPEVIAKTLKRDIKEVKKVMESLTDRGYLSIKITKQGEDEIVERTRTEKKLPGYKPSTTEITLRYLYDGPQDDRNRPFCAKLMSLNKVYSRADIERLSEILGYSVWDRRGGWFTQPDGTARPSCRHKWFAVTVIRKK